MKSIKNTSTKTLETVSESPEELKRVMKGVKIKGLIKIKSEPKSQPKPYDMLNFRAKYSSEKKIMMEKNVLTIKVLHSM